MSNFKSPIRLGRDLDRELESHALTHAGALTQWTISSGHEFTLTRTEGGDSIQESHQAPEQERFSPLSTDKHAAKPGTQVRR